MSGVSKYRLMKDPTRERSDALETLREAAGLLTRSLDVRLIPLHGARLGYAIHGARDKNGVAAVKGGIVAGREKPHAAGPCDFGVDEDIARIILTVMRFDPTIPECGNPALFQEYADRLLRACFLNAVRLNQAKEPPGISTMDWGVASCCKEGVPDVCYPARRAGK